MLYDDTLGDRQTGTDRQEDRHTDSDGLVGKPINRQERERERDGRHEVRWPDTDKQAEKRVLLN